MRIGGFWPRPGRRVNALHRRTGAAEAAEDRERVPRDGLPDELAARLDLTVEPPRERLGVLLRVGADDQVPPAALHGIPLLLEPVRELAGLPVGRERDPDLPWGIAVLELLLLPALAGRLVVPAFLGLEPVLDLAGLRIDLVGFEHDPDEVAGALRLGG